MAAHVALIGEPAASAASARPARQHQPAAHIQPTQRGIAIGADAVQRAEIARQAPAVATAGCFQVRQGQPAGQSIMDAQACPLGRAIVERAATATLAGDGGQRLRQIVERVRLFQRIQGLAHRPQQRLGSRAQARIVGQTARHEAGAARPACAAPGRLDIEHAIAKTRVGAGLTVVRLVRMQHQRAAGQAVAQSAPVVKALHAGQGAADGIGVVAMHLIAATAEIGFDPFQPGGPRARAKSFRLSLPSMHSPRRPGPATSRLRLHGSKPANPALPQAAPGPRPRLAAPGISLGFPRDAPSSHPIPPQ